MLLQCLRSVSGLSTLAHLRLINLTVFSILPYSLRSAHLGLPDAMVEGCMRLDGVVRE